MINALVIARHSDPEATGVIELLEEHNLGPYSEGKVGDTFVRLIFSLYFYTNFFTSGSELHE